MRFSIVRRGTFMTLVTAAAVCLGLSATADARPVNVSKDLLTPGTLLVGSDIPFPPFEFGKKGNYDGYDVDLVRAMAKKLRLRVKWRDTPFDTIFWDLKSREFDLVASATTITPERRRVVSFSKPYYDAQQSLVVPPGSAIDSVRDLDGSVVGAQDGTTGEYFAKEETKAAKVIEFPNGPAAIRALRNGRVEATIIDQPVAQLALNEGQGGIEIAQNISTGERYGLAVSKATPRLLRGINWALRKVKADGTFKRLYRKWFGIEPPPSLRG